MRDRACAAAGRGSHGPRAGRGDPRPRPEQSSQAHERRATRARHEPPETATGVAAPADDGTDCGGVGVAVPVTAEDPASLTGTVAVGAATAGTVLFPVAVAARRCRAAFPAGEPEPPAAAAMTPVAAAARAAAPSVSRRTRSEAASRL